MLHISPDVVRSIPALEADNNSWRTYRGKRTVIVFVHGVLSNALACWYNKKSRTYWPDMVGSDQAFDECNVFLAGYYTAFDSTDFGLWQCSRALLSALREKGEHPAVMEHDRLIFVCHSLGGIVTRYMLAGWQMAFQSKQVALLLMASPSQGSRYADFFGNPIELLRNEIGQTLAWRSDELEDLDKRFSEYLQDRDDRRQHIPGMEGCEHRCLIYNEWQPWTWVWPRIVSPDSAGRYFRPARLIPDSTHSSIVKPDSVGHDSHKLLREFFAQRVEVQLPLEVPPPGSRTAAPPPAPVRPSPPIVSGSNATRAASTAPKPQAEFRCARLIWTIIINEDGDAPNDMAFERIVAANDGDANGYRLTPTWVHSGHTSRFEIDPDQSKGLFAKLRGEVQPRLVQQVVAFDVPPSAAQPQTLVLRSIDFNVYSMDVEEFHRKETEKQDDIDYVQKQIRWETIDELVLDITFPQNMRLRSDNAVSVHGYRIEYVSDTEYRERYDEDLTIKSKSGFEYDSKTRRATLRVQNPEPQTAYRIWWRLGPPVEVPKPAVVAIAEDNRTKLLSFRPLFDGTGLTNASGESKKAAVLNALASFCGQAIAEVSRSLSEVKPDTNASIDLERIDLSLMAVQKAAPPDEHEVLRVVAGMNVPEPYWKLELAMGDGIAGRAAKIAGRDNRIQFRRFRRGAEESMFNDAYLNVRDGPQHLWLLSIPLHEKCCDPICYGVLNIGAYDRHNAEQLESLSNKSIEVLEGYANGEFLRAVLNAVG